MYFPVHLNFKLTQKDAKIREKNIKKFTAFFVLYCIFCWYWDPGIPGSHVDPMGSHVIPGSAAAAYIRYRIRRIYDRSTYDRTLDRSIVYRGRPAVTIRSYIYIYCTCMLYTTGIYYIYHYTITIPYQYNIYHYIIHYYTYTKLIPPLRYQSFFFVYISDIYYIEKYIYGHMYLSILIIFIYI